MLMSFIWKENVLNLNNVRHQTCHRCLIRELSPEWSGLKCDIKLIFPPVGSPPFYIKGHQIRETQLKKKKNSAQKYMIESFQLVYFVQDRQWIEFEYANKMFEQKNIEEKRRNEHVENPKQTTNFCYSFINIHIFNSLS